MVSIICNICLNMEIWFTIINLCNLIILFYMYSDVDAITTVSTRYVN